MKKLVLGSLLLFVVATQATGCIITSGDDDGDDAAVTADWSFKTVSGQSLSCPPGFATVRVVNQPVDTQNRPVGLPFEDLFDCAAFHGVAFVPPDVYQTWIEVTNDSETQIYAQSTSAIVDVVVSDKNFAATIFDDGGYFSLSWDLADAATSAPLTCAQVPEQDGVRIISTVTNGTTAKVDEFNCDNHFGVSAVLLQGSYTVAAEAFQDGNPDLALGPATTLTNQTIRSPNKVTDLGHLIIKVD
jgi:hypothetical protein